MKNCNLLETCYSWMGVFLCYLDLQILFSSRVSFSYSEEFIKIWESVQFSCRENKPGVFWLNWRHRTTKWALSKHHPLGSTNTRELDHVNLMQKILSRVLVGPMQLNHLLWEVSLHCQTSTCTCTCTDPLDVCLPWLPLKHYHLQRITFSFTPNFI